MSRSVSRRRPVVLGVLALLVLGAAGLAYLASWFDGGAPRASDAASASASPGALDADAPAPDEVLGGPSAAPASGSPSTSTSTTTSPAPAPGALRPVAVNSTYAGWDPGAAEVVAGGFVSEVVETGGTCTLTLTRDGVTTSGTSDASPDAVTTSCGEVRAGGPELVPGSWDAVLSYESAESAGASAVFSVVVP